MTNVAFIDTETLGLDPARHPIWEVAAIVDDTEHVWQLVTDDLARSSADPIAVEISGFDRRYDRNIAVNREAFIGEFCELVQGRHWVGAVPSFDEQRIRNMFLAFNAWPDRFPWHYHLIDVEAMAVGAIAWQRSGADDCGVTPFPETPLPWKSDDLSRLLGVEPPSGDDRHTALADARWAKAIYEWIMR